MAIIRQEHIGGGIVRRTFTRGLETLRSGHELTREEVLKIPTANLQALVDNGKLSIFPPSGLGEHHVVSRGFGKFDVIRGHVLNDAPLTKEEAEAMAAELTGSMPDATVN